MKRRKRTLGLSPISQLHSPSDFQSLALLPWWEPSSHPLQPPSLSAPQPLPLGWLLFTVCGPRPPFHAQLQETHKGLKCLKEGNCPRWEPCEQAKGLGFLLSAGKEWQLNTELQRV